MTMRLFGVDFDVELRLRAIFRVFGYGTQFLFPPAPLVGLEALRCCVGGGGVRCGSTPESHAAGRPPLRSRAASPSSRHWRSMVCWRSTGSCGIDGSAFRFPHHAGFPARRWPLTMVLADAVSWLKCPEWQRRGVRSPLCICLLVRDSSSAYISTTPALQASAAYISLSLSVISSRLAAAFIRVSRI